ncbi:TIGR03899 family protein [Catenovulum adriaticum]|uniref:TIGR03899 family protein n=1 Tax=Catenovulum adriaticum TaxID=2984846 RepID=A0ABY7AMW5_9ALTE|nr:TIGR03899 family protein [Catenovulum sp. TS8]WAJ70897.1 TIGR03899 family protein [Catenovulum sp. TS8]
MKIDGHSKANIDLQTDNKAVKKPNPQSGSVAHVQKDNQLEAFPKAKVSIDNTANNLYRLQQIAHKFGFDKAKKDDKPLNLEQRANRRKRLKMLQKQQNVEQILEFSAEYIDSSRTQAEVDPDWLYQFFEAAESIYARPMQQLWGKILAMQTAKPNRFSLRALVTLKTMTYQEANIFQAACALAMTDKSDKGGKILTGLYCQLGLLSWFKSVKPKHLNLSKFGLSYPDLLSLIELGLIYSSEIESSPYPINHALALENRQHKINIKVKNDNTILTYYKLTQTGIELASLIAGNAKQDYFKQMTDTFTPELEISINSTQDS